MAKKKTAKTDSSLEVNKLTAQVHDLEQALWQSQERERRALADYQNFQRQTQQQRANLLKLANADLLLIILEPLEHLSTASEHIQDEALTMIINQLW